jgi:hypothetical protein
MPSAPSADDVARWIFHLSDSDPNEKSRFARKLYDLGQELCGPLLETWNEDTEFRSLALPHGPATARTAKTGYPGAIVVGLAVQPDSFEKIRAANRFPRLADVPPDQDAMEFELHVEPAIEFDILTTREPGGPGAIARFLAKFGEGIQQIEIYVSDVDRATEILRERFGLAPLYPATRAGADGTRVNFFLAAIEPGKKALIELVEAKSPSGRH